MNSKLWIIAQDVYKKTVKSPAFIIMIVSPLVLLLLGYGAIWLYNKTNSSQQIGIYSSDPQVIQTIETLKNKDYHFKKLSSITKAQAQLKSEQLDYYVVVKVDQDTLDATIYGQDSPGEQLTTWLTQSLTMYQTNLRAQNLQLDAAQVATLSQQVDLKNKIVHYNASGQAETSADNPMQRFAIGYVACIVIFIIITIYAQIIANEIASEKGMRIMEVILSSVKAQTHFYGKLLGVLLAALTQFAIVIIFYGGFYLWKKDMFSFLNIDLSNLDLKFLLVVLLFVFVGCLLYSVLAALCGSLVNRAEDTAKAIVPITYLSLIGYFIGLTLGSNNPDNLIVKICGYLPFLSPYIEPIRLANGVTTNYEILISLGLNFVTLIGLVWFSGRMYKANVLIYNQRGILASLKESIRLMKNERK